MPVMQTPQALIDFPFKYGFGIIVLLNCEKCPARRDADVAQSAEHPPCKRAVTSSILVVGSTRMVADLFLKVSGKIKYYTRAVTQVAKGD